MTKLPAHDKPGVMDRREFFKATGKAIIPALGFIGFTLMAGKVQAANKPKGPSCGCSQCLGCCDGQCDGCTNTTA